MSTSTATGQQARARLDEAVASGVPCAPVRDLLPPGDVPAAYAVQSAWVAQRLAAGARIVGRKIGLTSPAVQAQLGVDSPDFGFLLDEMARMPNDVIDTGRLLQPRIEAEIAFVLGADLVPDATGAVTEEAAAAATARVVAALEIVDSRIEGWDITLVDTVADNASAALFVLGDAPRPLTPALDLAACGMTMWRGDEVVSSGTGAASLGHPLRALAWLATAAAEHGEPLRAGDVVLSGALGPVVPVGAGDVFRAEIAGLGAVSAHFGPAA